MTGQVNRHVGTVDPTSAERSTKTVGEAATRALMELVQEWRQRCAAAEGEEYLLGVAYEACADALEAVLATEPANNTEGDAQ